MQHDACLMEIIKHKDSSRTTIIGPTNPIGADRRSELRILSSGVCPQCYINSTLQLRKNHCYHFHNTDRPCVVCMKLTGVVGSSDSDLILQLAGTPPTTPATNPDNQIHQKIRISFSLRQQIQDQVFCR